MDRSRIQLCSTLILYLAQPCCLSLNLARTLAILYSLAEARVHKESTYDEVTSVKDMHPLSFLSSCLLFELEQPFLSFFNSRKRRSVFDTVHALVLVCHSSMTCRSRSTHMHVQLTRRQVRRISYFGIRCPIAQLMMQLHHDQRSTSS